MSDLSRFFGACFGCLALVVPILLGGCADRSGTRPPDHVTLLPVPRDEPRVHIRGSFSPPRRDRGALLVTPVVPMTPIEPAVPPPVVGLGQPAPAFPD